eukprot:jgi/Psemu1/9261/gm1.9261_g
MAPTAALTAAPTGSSGRKAGIANYTKPELEHLFRCMRSILPIGPEEWDAKGHTFDESALELQQRRQDKADEEKKVTDQERQMMFQVLIGLASGAGAITPNGKIKRKLEHL